MFHHDTEQTHIDNISTVSFLEREKDTKTSVCDFQVP